MFYTGCYAKKDVLCLPRYGFGMNDGDAVILLNRCYCLVLKFLSYLRGVHNDYFR